MANGKEQIAANFSGNTGFNQKKWINKIQNLQGLSLGEVASLENVVEKSRTQGEFLDRLNGWIKLQARFGKQQRPFSIAYNLTGMPKFKAPTPKEKFVRFMQDFFRTVKKPFGITPAKKQAEESLKERE